ncbi:protease [bacterium]|nr:protease [bacterium]
MAVRTNGYFFLHPMLLDTGADHTIFPADFASYIGHHNLNPNVVHETVSGIGGTAVAYIHTMRLSLVDPENPLMNIGNENVPSCVWHSSIKKYRFIHGFSSQFGLLGRDLIREWKKVSLVPTLSRWTIEITI